MNSLEEKICTRGEFAAVKKGSKRKSPALNNAGWLNDLDTTEVTIGRRNGHSNALREWAEKKYGKTIRAKSDTHIIEKLLSDGLVPVRVNGDHNLEDDGVFLIKKEVLRRAPCFSR